MGLTLALAALAAVLVFAVIRPHRWPEAVIAVPAAAMLIAVGAISPDMAMREVNRLLPVVGFLAAVLVLARLCDDEGVFRAAGAVLAHNSNGKQNRLLATVFAVAAATTAILSLDATVVLLTPIVLATTRFLGVPARPHAYATAHLANSASLLLPVSNLTNLLAFTAAGLSFVHFTAVMTMPWLAAIAVEFVLLRWLFARDLAVAPQPRHMAAVDVPWAALVVLGLTLAGFVVASTLGLSPAWAALGGVLVLGVRGVRRRRGTVARMVAAADVPFLLFVLCLGVVVDAVMVNGLGTAMRGLIPSGTTFAALLGVAAIAALLSNLVNNLPAVLVMLPLVSASGPAAVMAVLIGVNVGPNLTYVGSLANLLWRAGVRHQMAVGPVEFSRTGAWTVPVTLVAAVAALWLAINLLGM